METKNNKILVIGTTENYTKNKKKNWHKYFHIM